MHVVGVDFQGFFPGDIEAFLLDEAVLDVAGGCGGLEDGFVVDAAVAKLLNPGLAGGRLATGADEVSRQREVFHVEHGDAVAEFVQQLNRVAAAYDDPAAVHFNGDLSGIGKTHELGEWQDAFGLSELDGVIVVAELHAGCGYFTADPVELIGVPFPVVHDEVFVVFVGRGFAGEGADDVFEAEVVAESDGLIEIFMQVD